MNPLNFVYQCVEFEVREGYNVAHFQMAAVDETIYAYGLVTIQVPPEITFEVGLWYTVE